MQHDERERVRVSETAELAISRGAASAPIAVPGDPKGG
jgi:hypothetical protein